MNHQVTNLLYSSNLPLQQSNETRAPARTCFFSIVTSGPLQICITYRGHDADTPFSRSHLGVLTTSTMAMAMFAIDSARGPPMNPTLKLPWPGSTNTTANNKLDMLMLATTIMGATCSIGVGAEVNWCKIMIESQERRRRIQEE